MARPWAPRTRARAPVAKGKAAQIFKATKAALGFKKTCLPTRAFYPLSPGLYVLRQGATARCLPPTKNTAHEIPFDVHPGRFAYLAFVLPPGGYRSRLYPCSPCSPYHRETG
ncbi:hypothetical protein GCM10027346_35940 [Hymenobacter seoulensis]